MRIEWFYRPTLKKLAASFHALDASADSRRKKASANCLKNAIYKFWSTWYPLPPDTLLLNEAPTDENTIGYTGRRRKFIFDMLEENDNVKDPNTKKMVLRKVNWLPYGQDLSTCRKLGYFTDIPIEKFTPELPDAEDIDLQVQNFNEPELTVQIEDGAIEFGPGALSVKFFISNPSNITTTNYCIQVGHPDYFQVSPSLGVVNPGESMPITVTFTPKPNLKTREHKVKSYLCIRDGNGFPKERIALTAYNHPAIYLRSNKIEVGYSMVGCEKKSTLLVENLLNVECPLVMVVKNHGSAFKVSNTQEKLSPLESRTITIHWTPEILGQHSDILYLLAFGTQLQRIVLEGQCGSPLQVLETDLKFGPMDINFPGISRSITLINRDPTIHLPVSITSSSNEFVINKGQPVVLAPKEERAVPIEFWSSFCGSRKEDIRVNCPNMTAIHIEATGTAGPEIIFPSCEDLFFPPVSIGQTSFLRVPVTNITDGPVTFALMVEKDVPVKIETLDGNFVNRKPVFNAIETKIYQAGNFVGVMVSLISKTSVLVEISFQSTRSGLFKTPLKLEIIKPKKQEFNTNYLYAAVLDHGLVTAAKSIRTFRDFYQKPFLYPKSEFNGDKSVPESSGAIIQSPLLRFAEQTKCIFGGSEQARSGAPCQYVTLLNLTDESQHYKLVLSSQFTTTAPLEGEIFGNMSMEIPLYLEHNINLNQETIRNTAFGTIWALDNDSSLPGMTVCQLQGYVGELVDLQLRRNTEAVRFPPTAIMETTKRTLFIRNKSPLELDWTADLVPAVNSSLLHSFTGMPFVLSQNKVLLKPYEYFTLEMTFQSPNQGDYRCRLNMQYGYLNAGKSYAFGKRNMTSLYLESSVGESSILVSTSDICFGDVALGDKIAKTVTLINTSMVSSKVNFADQLNVSIQPSELLIPAKSTVDAVVTYSAKEMGVWATYLSFSSEKSNQI